MFFGDPFVSKGIGKSEHSKLTKLLPPKRPPVIGGESGSWENHDHQVVPMRMNSRDQESQPSLPQQPTTSSLKPIPLPKPRFYLGKDPASKNEDLKDTDNAKTVAGGVLQSQSESGSVRSEKDSSPSVVGSGRGFEPEGNYWYDGGVWLFMS